MNNDLYEEILKKREQLNISMKRLRKSGAELASAEKEYKMLLTKETLRLRDEGMAVGMINLIIYGLPNVAEMRFKRDVCKSFYEANWESINVLKLELKLIERQLDREWDNVKML